MPLFGRKATPPVDDSAMMGLSEMFWQYPQTPGSDLLAGGTFDYGAESLAKVETYLVRMRTRNPEGRDAYSMILRAGAYVGEVVRRNSKRNWHWLKYEGALQVEPRLRNQTTESLATQWVLWDGEKGFVFPLGNVIKCYERGESLTSFVSSLLRLG